MLNNEFPLDKKSIAKLASNGLSLPSIRSQLNYGLDLSLELWKAQGLNIIKKRGYFFFKTKFIPINEATFCIVDIETNGSKIDKHQIIEIAAIKIKNNNIVDTFDSLVRCKTINKHITKITGITTEDTKDAPELEYVLKQFKLFLGDSIFVAHDVKFDYTFISKSFVKIGLEPLLNRSLCSLSLAERTIKSYKYGLAYLNNLFCFNKNATHHRAMSDVLTTYGLFKMSLENCNVALHNVEDLIKFSATAPRIKRPKLDPLKKEENVESE
jgi:DNA polymerase-3 subunit epsilon